MILNQSQDKELKEKYKNLEKSLYRKVMRGNAESVEDMGIIEKHVNLENR